VNRFESSIESFDPALDLASVANKGSYAEDEVPVLLP
jgi:hypothetical protein